MAFFLHLFFIFFFLKKKSSQKKRQLKNSDISLETTLYQVHLKREKEDIVSALHISHEKRRRNHERRRGSTDRDNWIVFGVQALKSASTD